MPTTIRNLDATRAAIGIFFFTLALIVLSSATVKGEQPNTNRPYAEWVDSYDEALAQARLTGRPIMLVFTGSDWCQWCKRLSDEVFLTHEFSRWTTQNVIKVEVDFPRSYTLSPELQKQNQALKNKFGRFIQAYPSVIFIDENENLIGKAGYVPGGPKKWIEFVATFIRPSPNDKVAALDRSRLHLRKWVDSFTAKV